MFTIDDKHFRLFEVILAPRKTGKSAESIRLETNELIREKPGRGYYIQQLKKQKTCWYIVQKVRQIDDKSQRVLTIFHDI